MYIYHENHNFSFKGKNEFFSDKCNLKRTSSVTFIPIVRLTHVAVDVVATRLSGSIHVVFVAGEGGLIRKMSVVPDTEHTCLLEVLSPFPQNSTIIIHTLKFLKDTVSPIEYCLFFIICVHPCISILYAV